MPSSYKEYVAGPGGGPRLFKVQNAAVVTMTPFSSCLLSANSCEVGS